MTASSQKETKFIFRIKEELFQKYKSLCEKRGYTMSNKLRGFIESEINKEEINLIETDIENYMKSIMWEFNTPAFRKTIKENVDKIMEKYTKSNMIYNYYVKCDNENNIDNNMSIIDVYLEKDKGDSVILNSIVIKPKGEISKNGFKTI